MPDVTVAVKVVFTQMQIRSYFVDIVEGAMPFFGWCDEFEIEKPDPDTLLKPWYNDPSIYQPGLIIRIGIDDDDKREVRKIAFNDIVKGLKIMGEKYPRHFADLQSDYDVVTTNILIQCIVFGELLYE